MAQFVKIGDDFLNLDNVALVRDNKNRVCVFFTDDGEEPGVIYYAEERDALLAAVQGGQTDAQAEFAVRLTNENKALRGDVARLRGLLVSVDQCAPMEVATHLGDDYPDLADAINSVRDYLAEAVS